MRARPPGGATDWSVDGINNRGDLCGWYITGSGPFHGFVIIGGRFHTVNAPAAGHSRGEGTEVTSIAYNRSYAGTLGYAAEPDFNHLFTVHPSGRQRLGRRGIPRGAEEVGRSCVRLGRVREARIFIYLCGFSVHRSTIPSLEGVLSNT